MVYKLLVLVKLPGHLKHVIIQIILIITGGYSVPISKARLFSPQQAFNQQHGVSGPYHCSSCLSIANAIP